MNMPAHDGCRTCSLPKVDENFDYAIVWPAQRHTAKKIVNLLEGSHATLDVDRANDCIIVKTVNCDELTSALNRAVTKLEADDTRGLLCNSKTPTLGEFKDVVSLTQLIDRMNGRWVISMLEDKRYVSYAQPIVSADGNWESIGHEFLFRGIDDEGNLIPPDILFSSAKDAQLLFNLDRTARINAVQTAAKMNNTGDVFINFIPGSVYDPNVCLRTTVAAAEELGVSSDRIVIEIVESHQIDEIDHLRDIVSYYRKSGFRIALDDFGTGFNNLDMYVALDPDFVKLDKSLTSNLTDDDPRVGTVKGIVRAARASGIKVIAEGVETAANARVVSDCGVDQMQGYFFGHPAPVEELAAQLTYI